MAVFGLPFFAAGVFMLLAGLGVVPISNADEVSTVGRLVLPFMGIIFTAVGGTLSFGRAWTTIDATRREVTTELGLLVPMHTSTRRVDEYATVHVGFVKGDSDTADSYPVSLKTRAGQSLKLWSSTQFPDARASATAIATLLRFDVEDATTDHPVRLAAGEADLPLQQRIPMDERVMDAPDRPANARSEISREHGALRVSIPTPRTHPFAIALTLIPVALSAAVVSPLSRFFKDTHTPDVVGWAFLGFLILFFGILPAMTALNGYLRSRRGCTIVTVSSRGIDIRERGAWTSGPVRSLAAADILDIDFSTAASVRASAKLSAQERVLAGTRPGSTAPEIGPRTERLLAALSRFAHGQGITIKTRQGLTTVATGLSDDETRYLHGIIRRALAG